MKEALNRLLTLALSANASDIHLTLENNQCQLEWRINGQLMPMPSDSFIHDKRLFHYLKYISHCELSNMSSPQSGSFEVMVNNKKVACRFAILSTRFRQAGVIRLLNQGSYIPLEKLTPDGPIIQLYRNIINYRNGLVIISGTTGSGKTTSAYSLLNAMDKRKVYTIEDPIEIYYPKLMQVQVNESNGLSYANAIKQIMRHDPDVLFIGEIRDEIAAKMALRSALTGHLVIATLHASNCLGAIYRLLDLNLDQDQLFQVLTTITCQMLVTETNHNVKFSIVEALDQNGIATFNQTGAITYETLEQKIRTISYQKAITY